MKDVGPGIPSTSALLAFEATARLGSIARAAEELEVSSPAISRHISKLERALYVRLFERKSGGLVLTGSGEDYFASVQSSIQSLRAASNKLRTEKTILTIGCTQGVSVMLLLPLYPRLQSLFNEYIDIRILSCEDDLLSSLPPLGIDLLFEYSTGRSDEHSARLFEEEIVPVASPYFKDRLRHELAEHPSRWVGVPRLDSAPAGAAWATWETWFKSQSCQSPEAPIEMHENYLYLAEAAAKEHGIALGWNVFLRSYLEDGRLVPLHDEWLRTGIGFYAVLTKTGQRNPSARRFLTELTDLVRELRVGSEELKSLRERWASRPPDVAQYQTDEWRRVGSTAMRRR